ncbi:hypothetical protein PR202_ga28553 [Eleusine coracana subsp. coracana]|uniref:F-box domain-containing protein n=1 Tax=Eleusine coracana subsp. coracana TaxID=191504 RepID=A0AAV5DIU4_ELECO|nr:hypothetical protein PR202_ga28553 [Eleusine coracana subsp. coracana]
MQRVVAASPDPPGRTTLEEKPLSPRKPIRRPNPRAAARRSPAPRTMEPPRPVPELMDEVVDEILVRCPPHDPARLLRAALVCRRWRRIVSDPGFRRRFIERHRAPPMLGFLCNIPDDDLYLTARFVPTPDFRPRRAVGDRGRAVDARHGRVLLHSVPLDKMSFRFDLVVWDPITDEQRALPRLSLHASPWTWNAAVLCAGVGGSCDHLDCHCAPFLVLLVAVFNDRIVSVTLLVSKVPRITP